MADYILESRVWLARARPEVFAFFAAAENLVRLTPPSFHLAIVDVQVRGPYARWEHRHRFLEERGGTWVEDRITYRLPLGPLGRAAHVVFVRRQIAAMWRYRTRRLGELVGPVSSPPAG